MTSMAHRLVRNVGVSLQFSVEELPKGALSTISNGPGKPLRW